MEAVAQLKITTYKEVANIVSKKNENNPQIFDLTSSAGSARTLHRLAR